MGLFGLHGAGNVEWLGGVGSCMAVLGSCVGTVALYLALLKAQELPKDSLTFRVCGN